MKFEFKPEKNSHIKKITEDVYYDFGKKIFVDGEGNRIPLKKLVEMGLLDEIVYLMESEDGVLGNKEDFISSGGTTADQYMLLLLMLENILIELESNSITPDEAKKLLKEHKEQIEKFKDREELKNIIKELYKLIQK